jgi:flagellar export protein FliJ
MADQIKRFNRVLLVREAERDITQGELAVKMKEEESILERINNIEARREDALADFCAVRDCIISPQQLWFERQNLDIMEKALGDNKEELKVCRVEIEEKKSVLIERHQNVQLMEKYVGKLRDKNNAHLIKDEQNGLDDVTSMRFLWGGGGMRE